PSSALNCNGYRLVKRLVDSAVPCPRTLIHASSAPLPPAGELKALCPDHQKVWIKRGDVHAERPEDVVAASLDQVADALRAFTRRGIPWVALQEHVPGPVVKFYGVTDGRFFNWYGSEAGFAGERPAVDENRLKALARCTWPPGGGAWRCSASSRSTAARVPSCTTWTATAMSICWPAWAWRASDMPIPSTSRPCSARSRACTSAVSRRNIARRW